MTSRLQLSSFFFNLTVSALLSLVSCLLIDPVYGFYDSFGATLMSGSITEVPITETFHLGLYPVSKLIGVLHLLAPALPWSGITILICWILVQSIFITLIQSLLKLNAFNLLYTILLWLLSTSLSMGFSLIEFSGTGIGILLSFIAMIGLWYAAVKLNAGFSQYIAMTFFTLMFFAGLSWRIESGVGGAAIGACFVLSTTRSFKKIFLVFILPALVTTAMVFNLHSLLKNHTFFREVEPMVYYVTDSRNPPPLMATDSADMVKLTMARAAFLIDTSVFNYDLFKRMASDKADHEKQMITNPAKAMAHIISVAEPTIMECYQITCLYLLLLAYCIYAATKARLPNRVWCVVIFNGAVWLIIAVAAYTMKMEKWHYVPILQCTTMGNLLMVAMIPSTAARFANPRFRIAVAGVSLFGLFFLTEQLQGLKASLNEKIALRKAITAEAENKLIFLDVNSREILDDYVFRQYKPASNVVLYDMAQIPFLPQYEKQLNKLCACNSHNAQQFFSFLKKNAADVHYISSPYRVQYLQDFAKLILQIPLKFVPVNTYDLRHLNYGSHTIVNYKIVFE